MFNFIKMLGSKTILKKTFFKKIMEVEQINISVNEHPQENSFNCKFVVQSNGENWGIDYTTNNKQTHYIISKNTFALHYREFKILKNSVVKKFEYKKANFIAHQIKTFTQSLSTITPQNNPGEEKVNEWLRVSLEVLKKALTSIDHKNTILCYKLFFGQNSIRIIIYNIDIELINFNNKVIFKAFNYKNDKEKFKDPVYNVELKYSYNDIFNQFIMLLNEIRQTENKYLKA